MGAYGRTWLKFGLGHRCLVAMAQKYNNTTIQLTTSLSWLLYSLCVAGKHYRPYYSVMFCDLISIVVFSPSRCYLYDGLLFTRQTLIGAWNGYCLSFLLLSAPHSLLCLPQLKGMVSGCRCHPLPWTTPWCSTCTPARTSPGMGPGPLHHSFFYW